MAVFRGQFTRLSSNGIRMIAIFGVQKLLLTNYLKNDLINFSKNENILSVRLVRQIAGLTVWLI